MGEVDAQTCVRGKAEEMLIPHCWRGSGDRNLAWLRELGTNKLADPTQGLDDFMMRIGTRYEIAVFDFVCWCDRLYDAGEPRFSATVGAVHSTETTLWSALSSFLHSGGIQVMFSTRNGPIKTGAQ